MRDGTPSAGTTRTSTPWSGSWLRPALVVVLLALVTVAATPAATLAREGREPVLLLHGHNPDGRSDCDQWTTLARQLRSPDEGYATYRFTGPIVPVAYYGGDTKAANDDWGDRDCSWRAHVSNHGRHQRVSPSGHRRVHGVVGHTTGTSIRHLAYHFAWFVHDRYTRRRTPVDIVGASMGGLIARYAIAATATHQRSFPPRLLVDDVVTLGTPLAGNPTELFTSVNRQTREMDPDSEFMAWLHAHAQRPPQGARVGTDWTFVGSYQDGLVMPASTVGRRCDGSGRCTRWLRAQHYVLYDDADPTSDSPAAVTHGAYQRLTGYEPTFRARVHHDAAWEWSDAFVPPVRLIEWALARDDW